MRYSLLRNVFFNLVVLIITFVFVPFVLAAQIRFAWDPNTEPDLAGYKVYYGTTSHNYGTAINVGNVTTYTLTGLTSGQTYYIAVTAYDRSNNESGFSNEVSGAATDPTQTYPHTFTSNPAGLQITIDGTTYNAPQTFNWTAGSSHTISSPSPQVGTGTRHVFVSWSDGGAQSHTIAAPSTSTTYTVNLATQYSLTTSASPPGGGTVSPSGVSWYNAGQSVSVSATANAGYSFVNWSGYLTGSVKPASLTMSGPKSVTANFATASETVSTPTRPAGTISGITGTGYSFSAGGATSNLGHTVAYQFDWRGDGTDLSAWGTATQTKTWTVGGTYQVRARARCVTHASIVSGWSNGLSVSINSTGVSYTVATNPIGLQITVDGSNYTGPKAFNWVPGSSHTVTVASPQTASGARYLYSSWSDGGTQSHSITAPSSSTTYTANFTIQYSLTTSVNPSGGGTVTPSGTHWYNAGQSVSVSATENSGYRFSGWSGDLSAVANPFSVIMTGPKNATANFSALAGYLVVTPAIGLSVSGPSGGPFSPSSQIYKLRNKGVNPINWLASKTQTWVSLSLKTGSLDPGGTVSVKVTINNNAYHLKAGSYNETITFSDAANGSETLSIPINLVIKPRVKTYTVKTNPAGLQFIVDGTSYTAPQIFNWAVDSSHTLEAPSPQNGSAGVQYRFNLWSNRGPQKQTISARPLGGTYTAYFTARKALTSSANPSEVVTGTSSGTNFLDHGGTEHFKRADFTSPETSALPMIGELENPSKGKRVFGTRTIYGWALDGEGISKVKLFIDGEYISEIPYGGLTEGLKETYPDYPNAERGGFALVWDYSNLPHGDHFVQIEVQNIKGEVLRLGANVIVHKISGEMVNQVNPMDFVIPGVNLTVDGNTKTYDLRLEWSNESQAFEIIDLYPR